MRMTIEPRAGAPWWWQVDDDDAVYSGTAQTPAEAWRQAHEAVDRASPVMVARVMVAGLDVVRARTEGEAAGYRRAIDEACAALDRRYDVLTQRLVEGDHYGAGRLRGLDLAEEIVRALAPVEPVSNADKLPGGDR